MCAFALADEGERRGQRWRGHRGSHRGVGRQGRRGVARVLFLIGQRRSGSAAESVRPFFSFGSCPFVSTLGGGGGGDGAPVTLPDVNMRARLGERESTSPGSFGVGLVLGRAGAKRRPFSCLFSFHVHVHVDLLATVPEVGCVFSQLPSHGSHDPRKHCA